MNPEEFFGNDYSPFNVLDPFNGNQLEGYISRRATDVYGAILISRVNEKDCPQLILCTPKMHYPFDKNGKWNFPKAVRIERYEKLDGTNIFAYRYHDEEGSIFVGYKTRLLPIVGNSKFGPFQDMLKEIFIRHPSLMCLPLYTEMNISFELWGARNPHLVKYEIPLELSILFARNGDKIIPPSEFDTYAEGVVPLKGIVTSDSVQEYEKSQKDMEATLTKTEDGYYQGSEGEVWYLKTEDGLWQQFKCKPETIEAIHWSVGGIGKNQITATCENALENWDSPTIENIVSLLQEEFSQDKIDKVYYRISKCLQEVIEKHAFMDKVMQDYNQLGVNILEDKTTVMRALAGKYNQKDMRRVYGIIFAHTVS